jgi:hypothetical protein
MFRKAPIARHWHSIDTLNSGLVAPQAAPSTDSGSAGFAVYAPLMVRERVTVKKLWLAASGTGSDVHLALYDADLAKVIGNGGAAHPDATTEMVSDVTDTLIPPGIYYFAWLADTDDAGLYIVNTATAVNRAYGVLAEGSGLTTLPSSITNNAAWSWLPVGGILTNTVVS